MLLQQTYTMVTDGADPASPVLSDDYTVYTPGISERTSGVTSFYHMDAQGSVVATTSSAQAQTGDMRYDAFGNKTYYVNTAKTFGWNAKSQYQTDANSGLMLLGNRYYDSTTGRFISQDPAQDESNWYSYCGNNPLVAVDPTGLKIAVQPRKIDPDFVTKVNDAINDAIKKGTDKTGKMDAVATMLTDMKNDPKRRYWFFRRDQDPQTGHTAAIGDGSTGITKIYIPGSDKRLAIGSAAAGNQQTVVAPSAISLIHESGHADGKTGGFGNADPGGVPNSRGVQGAVATPVDSVGAIDIVGRADYGYALRPCC